MRGLLFFLPVVLMAQVSPSTQPASKPKSHPSTVTKPRPAAVAPPLTSDDQRTIYALGLSIYRSLARFDLSPAELAIIKRALSDAAAGKPAVDLQTWGPKIQALAETRQRTESESYLRKAAAEPGAIKTESGLIFREVRAGTGASPKATDTVKVNYRGTLINGTEFDSSYSRNQPAEFALNRVIRCWTEGVQRMKAGGEAVLICPADLAYGDRAQGPIPSGATLIFHIELLEVSSATP